MIKNKLNLNIILFHYKLIRKIKHNVDKFVYYLLIDI